MLHYLSRRLGGDSVAGCKTELLRPHEAGGRRLARHYGDGFGKHFLSAVGRRLAACMGLAEAACQTPETASSPAVNGVNVLRYSQLGRRPRRLLLAWRTRASQNLGEQSRFIAGYFLQPLKQTYAK